MSFSLHIDAATWRSGVTAALAALPAALGPVGVVGLIESHPWGLSRRQLASEAAHLGLDTIAVATADDALAVAGHFGGEILVLAPWDPRASQDHGSWEQLSSTAARPVIRTIASTEALHTLAQTSTSCVPVVLAGLTSRNCIGLQEPDLDALLADDTIRSALREERIEVRGALLSLPRTQPASPQVRTIGGTRGDQLNSKASNRVREAWGWTVLWIRAMAAVEQSGIELHERSTTIWVDQLDDSEVADLCGALDVVPIKVLRGSELWLAPQDALKSFATVLAVHRVERGRDVGDRQRRTPKDGYIVVLRGGLSHGIGVIAAGSSSSLIRRASNAAGRAMEAIGRLRSPFEWAGKRRRFVEPPGPSTSLVWLSSEDVSEALANGYRTPVVGDQWPCSVNPDVVRYDRVIGLG